MGDDFPFALTGGTGRSCLHLSQYRIADARNLARTTASGAVAVRRTVGSSRTFTVAAAHILFYLNLLFTTIGNLLQGQFHFNPEVGAFIDTLAATTSAKTAKTATKTTKATAKNITEMRKDVVHAHTATKAAASRGAANTGMSVLVVTSALVLIAQHLIGLSSKTLRTTDHRRLTAPRAPLPPILTSPNSSPQ